MTTYEAIMVALTSNLVLIGVLTVVFDGRYTEKKVTVSATTNG